ncbi:nucleotide exchange factor GrpE [Segatella bryantii]|uniref:nucleotide exchange factor GrpE n=1 Tax=Segatella bryantii TaxID=77095 RepID=UPI001EDA6BD1|nr:nucleotide exchange factor GrpE [Segatella bryantii]UKK73288.1 nucleotide exchange factor GrpE [Segatella bryantii]
MAKEKKIKVEDGNNKPEEEIKDEAQQQNPETDKEVNTDKKAEDSNKNEETTDNTEEKDPLEVAQAEIAELKDKYLRSVAEFDNYRKRTLKEKAELILNGGEKTISAILPILDDFERAIADKNEDAKAIKEGFELIYKKFNKTLEGMGVKKIETTDQDFNTEYHEAIAMVPGMGDDKKGKIIDCVEAGYTLNDKVIRHAKVAVGQ